MHLLLDLANLGLDGGLVQIVDIDCGLAVVLGNHGPELLEFIVNRSRIHVADLLGGLLQHPLGLVDDTVSRVDEVDSGSSQLVLLGELLRLGYLLLDLVFSKGGLALNLD